MIISFEEIAAKQFKKEKQLFFNSFLRPLYYFIYSVNKNYSWKT